MKVTENDFGLIRKVSETGIARKSQNWKVLEDENIRKSPNWKESEQFKTGKCQKMSKPKSVPEKSK